VRAEKGLSSTMSSTPGPSLRRKGRLQTNKSLAFPMHVISVKDLLELKELVSHVELVKAGKLRTWEPGMMAIFVSHQWLGKGHPDPDMKQFRVLQSCLRNIISGKCLVDTHWLSAIHFKQDEKLSQDVCESFENAYVWYDFFGVPQLNKSYDPEAGEQLMNAVNSIPDYINMCEYFFVLCPDLDHWTGSRCDFVSWLSRGWCRMEEISRRLCHFNKMVVVIQGEMQAFLYDSNDYLSLPIDNAAFTCCEMDHTLNGSTIACDKEKIAQCLGSLLTRLQDQMASSASEGGLDLLYLRLLKAITPTMLKGLPSPIKKSKSDLRLSQGILKGYTSYDAFLADFMFSDDSVGPTQGGMVGKCSCKTSPIPQVSDGGPAWGPLWFAVLHKDFSIAEKLIRRGAAVNQQSEADIPGVLVGKGSTVLHAASHLSPDGEAVRFLLGQRADVTIANGLGATPISSAAWAGHAENVKALLEVDGTLEMGNAFRASPLMCATDFPGRFETIKALVEAKADVNTVQDLGANPLMATAQACDVKAMRYLLDNRADINHRHTPKTMFASVMFAGAKFGHYMDPRLFFRVYNQYKGLPCASPSSHGWCHCLFERIAEPPSGSAGEKCTRQDTSRISTDAGPQRNH